METVMSIADHNLEVQFWTRVIKPAIGEPHIACWKWQGYHNADGYSVYTYKGETVRVHRLAYELAIGPIPDGLVIDHLCRHRWCVNPHHLEAVTNRENLLRGDCIAAANAAKTHCPGGHEYTEANTYRRPDGRRVCRQCQRETCRRYKAQKKIATPLAEVTI